MEENELILKILAAKRMTEVASLGEFIDIIKRIHPDRCHHPRANEATAHLNELRREIVEGTQFSDESGSFRVFDDRAVYSGDATLLGETLRNYKVLMSRGDSAARNFQKYLPKSMRMEGGRLEVGFEKRSVPLSGQTLPQKHVNWIYSRMIEFSAWLESIGQVHCGINPDTVFVVPETHGIQVCSLSLMAGIGSGMKGVSGRYLNWYPPSVFSSKTASPRIDLALSARTAIYLLGDKSGVGTKLRREPGVNAEILEFLLTQHDEAAGCFGEYRRVLGRNFKKEFHKLDI